MREEKRGQTEMVSEVSQSSLMRRLPIPQEHFMRLSHTCFDFKDCVSNVLRWGKGK